MIEHIIKKETGPSAKTEVLDLDMVRTWSGHGLDMVVHAESQGRERTRTAICRDAPPSRYVTQPPASRKGSHLLCEHEYVQN